MKKILYLLMMLTFAFVIIACGGQEDNPPESEAVVTSTEVDTPSEAEPAEPVAQNTAPVAEEVRGVTIPAFTITVNGVTIAQDTLAAYPVYSVQATSVNSSGTESTAAYVGFAIKDVLDAAALSETYVWMEAAADDGYTVTYTGDIIYEDTTLLAMTKDGSPFGSAPWLAPCSDQVTGNYLKNAVSILVNTTEGAPDISHSSGDSEESGGLPEGLPEILDRTERVEFAEYSFLVNGVEVTNETLEGLSIFKITAVTIGKNDNISEAGYTGYKLADVLNACGLEGYTTVTVVASDGYESEITGGLITSDHTLVAIEKDGEVGEDGTIWVAPCSETASKNYGKLVVEIRAE